MTRPGFWLAVSTLALAPLPLASAAQNSPDALWFDAHLPEVVGLYQHLHSHPELSNREFETAKRMADELRKAGAIVTSGVGQLGVVGLIKNGQGPTVLVRCEMDALPVTEATKLPFASRVTALGSGGRPVGVMHACGHDLHMTNLVGTARWLTDHKEPLGGDRCPDRPAGRGAGRWCAPDAGRRPLYRGSPSPISPSCPARRSRYRGGQGGLLRRTVDGRHDRRLDPGQREGRPRRPAAHDRRSDRPRLDARPRPPNDHQPRAEPARPRGPHHRLVPGRHGVEHHSRRGPPETHPRARSVPEVATATCWSKASGGEAVALQRRARSPQRPRSRSAAAFRPWSTRPAWSSACSRP